MKRVVILLLVVMCVFTGCGVVNPTEPQFTHSSYRLVELEQDGVLYIESGYRVAPYYSKNGKLCKYEDGRIVEID